MAKKKTRKSIPQPLPAQPEVSKVDNAAVVSAIETSQLELSDKFKLLIEETAKTREAIIGLKPKKESFEGAGEKTPVRPAKPADSFLEKSQKKLRAYKEGLSSVGGAASSLKTPALMLGGLALLAKPELIFSAIDSILGFVERIIKFGESLANGNFFSSLGTIAELLMENPILSLVTGLYALNKVIGIVLATIATAQALGKIGQPTDINAPDAPDGADKGKGKPGDKPAGGKAKSWMKHAGKLSVTGVLGGVAIDYAADKAKEAGHEKTATALDVAGSTVTGAGMGAALGSIAGPVGTIVGGAVGGVGGLAYGAYKNMTKPKDESKPTSSPDIIDKIINVESGGKATAKNPNSTATGLGQFTKGTFESLAKRKDSSVFGKTWEEYKASPEIQMSALKDLTRINQQHLQSKGIAATDSATYLAHFLGAAGASKLYAADNNALLTDVVGADQIAANKSVFKNLTTVGDLKMWSAKKMGEDKQLALSTTKIAAPDKPKTETASLQKELEKTRAETSSSPKTVVVAGGGGGGGSNSTSVVNNNVTNVNRPDYLSKDMTAPYYFAA